MRVLIADDEPLARQRIEDLLRKEPDVEIAGASEDGIAAAEGIRALRPDLVFLDIQMPGMTGLEVVSAVGADMPATIFVTAYDQHAIRAFEVAAVDYLVKPFDDERFAVALTRAREHIRLQEVARVTQRLLSVLGEGGPASGGPPAAGPVSPAASPAYLETIAVESRGRVEHVGVDAIDAIVARGPYAEIRVGDQAHLVRERMQALEARLDPARFVRIHRSAIVALDRVEAIQRRPGGEATVRLRGGQEMTVSRSRRQELEKRWAAVPGAERPL